MSSDERKISSVIIYKSPNDFPGQFVGRRFYLDFATSDYYASPDLGAVREWAKAQVLKFNGWEAGVIKRLPPDQPHILEVWL